MVHLKSSPSEFNNGCKMNEFSVVATCTERVTDDKKTPPFTEENWTRRRTTTTTVMLQPDAGDYDYDICR